MITVTGRACRLLGLVSRAAEPKRQRARDLFSVVAVERKEPATPACDA